jgi:hypothetical protein
MPEIMVHPHRSAATTPDVLMWSTETLWFDAAVVLGIFAVGNIVFGHFEAHKPTWKRILVVGFTAGCTPL